MTRRREVEPHDPASPMSLVTPPIFVDNRDGNTLSHAICQYLRALRVDQTALGEVSIASAYFNVSGFDLIASELDHVSRVRLLLGVEARPEAGRPERKPGDPPEPEFTRRQVALALTELDLGLQRGRDLMPFDTDADEALRQLLGFLHSGKIEVRRYEDQFLCAI